MCLSWIFLCVFIFVTFAWDKSFAVLNFYTLFENSYYLVDNMYSSAPCYHFRLQAQPATVERGMQPSPVVLVRNRKWLHPTAAVVLRGHVGVGNGGQQQVCRSSDYYFRKKSRNCTCVTKNFGVVDVFRSHDMWYFTNIFYCSQHIHKIQHCSFECFFLYTKYYESSD